MKVSQLGGRIHHDIEFFMQPKVTYPTWEFVHVKIIARYNNLYLLRRNPKIAEANGLERVVEGMDTWSQGEVIRSGGHCTYF